MCCDPDPSRVLFLVGKFCLCLFFVHLQAVFCLCALVTRNQIVLSRYDHSL